MSVGNDRAWDTPVPNRPGQVDFLPLFWRESAENEVRRCTDAFYDAKASFDLTITFDRENLVVSEVPWSMIKLLYR